MRQNEAGRLAAPWRASHALEIRSEPPYTACAESRETAVYLADGREMKALSALGRCRAGARTERLREATRPPWGCHTSRDLLAYRGGIYAHGPSHVVLDRRVLTRAKLFLSRYFER